MFPNNPSFMEKLVQTTQEEVLREVQDVNEYEFPHFRAFHIKSNGATKCGYSLACWSRWHVCSVRSFDCKNKPFRMFEDWNPKVTCP